MIDEQYEAGVCDQLCEASGASMLCIETEEQNDFVMSLLPLSETGGVGNAKVWLGYTDRSEEGQFVWDIGVGGEQDVCESTFEKWGAGQPLSVSSSPNLKG